MLNAAEARIFGAAEDETTRERARAQLYAPPRDGAAGKGRARSRTGPTPARMDMGQAQALMAQMAAEDARLGGPRAAPGLPANLA